MSWKDQLDKAVAKVKQVAESEQVTNLTGKARETSTRLKNKAKKGAVSAAEAFLEANEEPSALRVHYLNASFSIVSPSEGIQVAVPHAGTVSVSDAGGNGLVINASTEEAVVAGTVGTVKQISPNTYDLGAEDGVDVIVFKA